MAVARQDCHWQRGSGVARQCGIPQRDRLFARQRHHQAQSRMRARQKARGGNETVGQVAKLGLAAARQQLYPVVNLSRVGSRVLLAVEIFAVVGLLVAGRGWKNCGTVLTTISSC